MPTSEILALSDIQERNKVYNEQTTQFMEMVKKYTIVDGNLIITDLRNIAPIYSGKRFLIYSMYPEQNISAWIVSGGGHQKIGTCQFTDETMLTELPKMLAELKELSNIL